MNGMRPFLQPSYNLLDPMQEPRIGFHDASYWCVKSSRTNIVLIVTALLTSSPLHWCLTGSLSFLVFLQIGAGWLPLQNPKAGDLAKCTHFYRLISLCDCVMMALLCMWLSMLYPRVWVAVRIL